MLPARRRHRLAVVDRHVRRRVAADGHESGMTDRELSGETVDQVQADGQRDVDADEIDDARVVRVDEEVADAVLEDLIEDEKDARSCRGPNTSFRVSPMRR